MNHRQQCGARIGAQQADDIETAHVRQVDVEDQRIECFALDQGQAVAAGAGFEHRVTMALQAPAQGVTGGDVVIDNQQADVTIHRRSPERLPAG